MGGIEKVTGFGSRGDILAEVESILGAKEEGSCHT
jgi:hypothetical protein